MGGVQGGQAAVVIPPIQQVPGGIGVGTHRAGGALAPPFEIVEGLSQSFFGNYN